MTTQARRGRGAAAHVVRSFLPGGPRQSVPALLGFALAGALVAIVLVHYHFDLGTIGRTGVSMLTSAVFVGILSLAMLVALRRAASVRRPGGIMIVMAAAIIALGVTMGAISPLVLPATMVWSFGALTLLLPNVLAINIVVFVVLLGVLEAGYRSYEAVFIRDPMSLAYVSADRYVAFDSLVGYRPVHGSSRAVLASRSDTSYDIVYTIDSTGWRVVPQPLRTDRARFIAFFGCSFAFGEGVGDSATLPAAVARLVTDRRSYNRAFRGWGPAQMLALMEEPSSLAIPDQHGIAVYAVIDDQMRRLTGDFSLTTTWGAEFPYYRHDRAGNLERHGTFTSGRPWRQAAYQLISDSHVMTALARRVLDARTRPDWDLMADVLARSCTLFGTRFVSEGCYVVIWPGATATHDSLPSHLRARHVEVLDYSSLWPPKDSTVYQLRFDNHPTAAAHTAVARQLATDLAARGIR